MTFRTSKNESIGVVNSHVGRVRIGTAFAEGLDKRVHFKLEAPARNADFEVGTFARYVPLM